MHIVPQDCPCVWNNHKAQFHCLKKLDEKAYNGRKTSRLKYRQQNGWTFRTWQNYWKEVTGKNKFDRCICKVCIAPNITEKTMSLCWKAHREINLLFYKCFKSEVIVGVRRCKGYSVLEMCWKDKTFYKCLLINRQSPIGNIWSQRFLAII